MSFVNLKYQHPTSFCLIPAETKHPKVKTQLKDEASVPWHCRMSLHRLGWGVKHCRGFLEKCVTFLILIRKYNSFHFSFCVLGNLDL